MAGDQNIPTTEDFRQRIISSFTTEKSSFLEVTRLLLEFHDWDVDATVSAINEAYAAGRIIPSRRDREPRLLSALTRCLNHSPPPILSGEQEEDPVEAKDTCEDNAVDIDVETSSVTSLRTLREIGSVTPPQKIPQVVIIWRNGLTIEEDPPSELDDSKDPVFLEVVESLKSPHVHVSTDGKIRLRIKFKRYEKDYYPPFQAFQGVGRTLDGSVSASTEPLSTGPSSPAMVRFGDNTFRSDMKQRGGNIHTLADISSGTDNDTDLKTLHHDPDLDEENNAKKLLPEVRSRTLSDILSFTPQAIPRVLTLWSNSISYDPNPSPLKPDDAVENTLYLEFVEHLDSPFIRRSPDGKIHFLIKFIKRYQEDHNAPEAFQPFQGVGRKLGGSVSASSEPPPSMDRAESPGVGRTLGETEPPQASIGLVKDLEAPMTKILIILADGKWIVSTFNTHHTIRDIRGFIDASTPGDPSDYQLRIQCTPPKPLIDLEQTIEQAGISDSAIVQISSET